MPKHPHPNQPLQRVPSPSQPASIAFVPKWLGQDRDALLSSASSVSASDPDSDCSSWLASRKLEQEALGRKATAIQRLCNRSLPSGSAQQSRVFEREIAYPCNWVHRNVGCAKRQVENREAEHIKEQQGVSDVPGARRRVGSKVTKRWHPPARSGRKPEAAWHRLVNYRMPETPAKKPSGLLPPSWHTSPYPTSKWRFRALDQWPKCLPCNHESMW